MRNEGQKVEQTSEKPDTDKQLTSPEKVVAMLKGIPEAIKSKVAALFNSSDEEIDEYLQGVEQGYNLVVQASLKLKETLENSKIFPPEKDYEHGKPIWDDIATAQANAKLYRKGKFNPFAAIPAHRIKDRLQKHFVPQEGKLIATGDYVQRIQLPESNLILSEYVFEAEGEPHALLRVANPETKQVITLNNLLPNNTYFVPAVLIPGMPGIAHQKIQEYKGMQSMGEFDNEFSLAIKYEKGKPEKHFSKEVLYGNLTAPGGIISLLHEIGHSWDSVYHKARAGNNFEEFLHEVRFIVKGFLSAIEQKDEVKIYGFKDMLEERGIQINTNDNNIKSEMEYILKALPIEIYSKEKEVLPGQFSKMSMTKLTDTKITNKKLSQLFEKYVQEERIAWAHALKMLRFFRHNGIDLEPTLKTFKDIEREAHGALLTYDVILSEQLEPNPHVRPFTRLSRNQNKTDK